MKRNQTLVNGKNAIGALRITTHKRWRGLNKVSVGFCLTSKWKEKKMFDDEFDIALYRVALGLPEAMLDELCLDDPDLMDIEDLCVSWDEYELNFE